MRVDNSCTFLLVQFYHNVHFYSFSYTLFTGESEAIFFPGLFFINFSYFGSFLVVWGFVLGLGSYIWFLGLGFSVDGVWGLWCGALWVFLGWGTLYKHKRITLGKKTGAP